MPGTLYIVGTPIGNLGDFSPRAVETLRQVDFIAAEDTRVTQKLLNHFGLKKPMVSYYEHNKRDHGQTILARISAGESCAVVTDAGMPCISDPGEDLIREAHRAGVPVESVPGPSALVTALALSGMVSGRFTFEGFLSVNKPSRRRHLASLCDEARTMIFYEAPHKLCATLKDFANTFGEDREITLVKEITKIHEQVIRTTLGEATALYADTPPKGEFVLIVAGKPPTEDTMVLSDAVKLARSLMQKGESASAAAKQAAALSHCKKGDIYKSVLKKPTP